MKVLVCGGRDYTDRYHVDNVLDAVLWRYFGITELIHGGANGADRLAGDWASLRGIPVRVFHADWRTHGKAAGPIRNQKMLDESKPDLVVAFPGGRGTADMVCRAMAVGIEVLESAKSQ